MNKTKILLAPNSFKECADSVKVIELFEKYLKNDDLEVLKFPISDGGDGYLNTLSFNIELKDLIYLISTPYNNSKFNCNIKYDRKNKIIYIESAKVLGLEIIPLEKRHPLYLSSKGLGELLNMINNSILAGEIDVNKVVLGIGGTGTNDLGLGVCSIFGMNLYDIYNNDLKIIPKNFSKTNNIIWSKPKLEFEIECIVDVSNPLLGEKGATNLFASQKGATKEEIELLEIAFARIYNVLRNNELYDLAKSNYGAGGGLAAGLSIFFNSNIISAFDSMINDKLLIKKMEQADIIITGEGKFDETTLIGKGVSAILQIGKSLNKKVFLCCGQIDDNLILELNGNMQIIQLNKFSTIDNYKLNFEKEVENACKIIVQAIS